MLVSCHYDEAPAGLTTFMSIRKEYIDIPTSLETSNADNTVGYFFSLSKLSNYMYSFLSIIENSP